VVSSEFTFYDGTKSFLDDSSYSEKLIRAKLDLSFMYASKEKDTWIRALVKDFTVEAGSGLIILDPVDISGGYTSAYAALNFGNATPLVPCTNFDRLWVSEKETGPKNNITFWRPQAPANYVVLGDCVTS
ncbi:calcium-dependent lipid-binding family protein, partial [Trifolium medium]|nr:calcium-dependent lipid-binding family protein [Trifolium medium]